EAAHAQAGRRHGPGERHADRGVGLEHALGEELAAFPQAARVVRQEGVVDQRGHGLLAGNRGRLDALAAQVRGGGSGHALVLEGGQPTIRATASSGFSARASITMRAASAGSSVTRNSSRSVGLILRSSATVRVSHSTSPAQYALPNNITGKCFTLPVWISVSASNSSSSVP